MQSRETIKQQHRKNFVQEVNQIQNKRDEAMALLDQEALETIKKLIQFRDKGENVHLQFDATKYLAKLQGFEIERHEHSGNAEKPLGMILYCPEELKTKHE